MYMYFVYYIYMYMLYIYMYLCVHMHVNTYRYIHVHCIHDGTTNGTHNGSSSIGTYSNMHVQCQKYMFRL